MPAARLNRDSDVRKQIEVLVVFVLAALAFADRLLGLDELDAFDPFDHLVAKLILDAQPQRRPVDLRSAGSSFISKARMHSGLSTFSMQLRIVISPPYSEPPNEKNATTRAAVRGWTHEFDQLSHGDAAPLRDARPALDAVVHRDVLDFSEPMQIAERKLDLVFDQTADLQPVIRKPFCASSFQSSRSGILPFGQKYGEICCSV